MAKSEHSLSSDYQFILNNVPDGIVTIDKQNRVSFVNEAAKKLLGIGDEAVLGKECKTACQINACKTECILKKTLETGEEIENYETEIINKKGELIPVSLSNSIIRDGKGKSLGTVHVIRDISRIKFLTGKLEGKYSFDKIIGKNYKIREIFDMLLPISQTKSTVIIEGESGTGKELIAEAIHYNSPRKNGPLVKVNCGALSEGILESELFGHVKGAFTGAVTEKIGRFELADKGTVFLDEVGDMSPSLQVKLLRVLQEETFEKVGSNKTLKVDVRVVAATNKDLRKLVEEKKFREDLYFRLRVVPIYIPPLRERKDDIPLLIKHFLNALNKKLGKRVNNISSKVMDFLLNYDYPGNVRELENLLEHCLVLSKENTILPDHFPKQLHNIHQDIVDKALATRDPLKTLERDVITKVLSQTKWKYQEAAKRLGLSRTTLWRRMKELDITKD